METTQEKWEQDEAHGGFGGGGGGGGGGAAAGGQRVLLLVVFVEQHQRQFARIETERRLVAVVGQQFDVLLNTTKHLNKPTNRKKER